MRIEEIEKYLTHEMPSDDRRRFEGEMDASSELQEDVKMVAYIIEAIQKEGHKEDNQLLNSIRKDIGNDKKRMVATITAVATTLIVAAALCFTLPKFFKRDVKSPTHTKTYSVEKIGLDPKYNDTERPSGKKEYKVNNDIVIERLKEGWSEDDVLEYVWNSMFRQVDFSDSSFETKLRSTGASERFIHQLKSIMGVDVTSANAIKIIEKTNVTISEDEERKKPDKTYVHPETSEKEQGQPMEEKAETQPQNNPTPSSTLKKVQATTASNYIADSLIVRVYVEEGVKVNDKSIDPNRVTEVRNKFKKALNSCKRLQIVENKSDADYSFKVTVDSYKEKQETYGVKGSGYLFNIVSLRAKIFMEDLKNKKPSVLYTQFEGKGTGLPDGSYAKLLNAAIYNMPYSKHAKDFEIQYAPITIAITQINPDEKDLRAETAFISGGHNLGISTGDYFAIYKWNLKTKQVEGSSLGGLIVDDVEGTTSKCDFIPNKKERENIWALAKEMEKNKDNPTYIFVGIITNSPFDILTNPNAVRFILRQARKGISIW